MLGRDESLQKMLDQVSLRLYGRTQTEAFKKSICVECGKQATEFKDLQSRLEYELSILCQGCQDKAFDKKED